jgi:hypothetical protein
MSIGRPLLSVLSLSSVAESTVWYAPESSRPPILGCSFQQETGNRSFGKTSRGIGDLDRAAGVFLGQLGIPAEVAQYIQYLSAPDGEKPGGDGPYTITIDPEGLIRDKKPLLVDHCLQHGRPIPDPEPAGPILDYFLLGFRRFGRDLYRQDQRGRNR